MSTLEDGKGDIITALPDMFECSRGAEYSNGYNTAEGQQLGVLTREKER